MVQPFANRDNQSRFVQKDDPKQQKFVFQLPEVWWSRPYEYAWAAQFAQPGDVSLDAASGICHPLKFYLADLTGEVHACDIDPRIKSPEAIIQEIHEQFGEQAALDLPKRYLTNVYYSEASLLKLPYPDQKFDKIYCISVLEHLLDSFNRYQFLSKLMRPQAWGASLLHRHMYLAFREFKRVLKADGLMVLTFDYPRVNLSYLEAILTDLQLDFAYGSVATLPNNALFSAEHQLYCYRAVIKKQA